MWVARLRAIQGDLHDITADAGADVPALEDLIRQGKNHQYLQSRVDSAVDRSPGSPMCISRQFNQLGVIVIPQVLITLGQDHNALGIKGPHSTLIMGHEHDSPAIPAQCSQDLLPACRVKVVGRFIEEENIGT